MSTLADRIYYQVNNTEYQAAVRLGLDVYTEAAGLVTTKEYEAVSEDRALIQFKCRDTRSSRAFESLLTAAGVTFTKRTKSQMRTAARSAAWRNA